ncbi:MAG: ROK family protein [Gammaproteobacteria bacterium]
MSIPLRKSKRVLVIDVGGSHVKVLVSGRKERRRFVSGPRMTPERVVEKVKATVAGWRYDTVTLGIPGPILHGRVVAQPPNLGPGWTGFDYAAAFERPVKIMNDAAMQALGAYSGGRMLFLGLGTGLGSALIIDGSIEAMELGHLPYKKKTYEDYVGARGLEKHGLHKWRKHVFAIVDHFVTVLLPEYTVIGGGNAGRLKQMPPGCRLGNNADAFLGGYRIWETTRERAS